MTTVGTYFMYVRLLYMSIIKEMSRIIILLIILSTVTAQAQVPDSAVVERSSLWRATEQAAWINPAIHKDAFRHSRTEIGVSLSQRNESKPFTPELGDGHTLPSLEVNTFLRLSERTSVWGSAAYMNGTVRDIKWNSSSDYEKLKPYILADTIGGDTKKEGYYFTGAYATELNKFALGAELLFSAEHEYRDRDPRMRGITTDLTMRAGAAREIASHKLGLSLEGNIYKQTNNVDFYNELGVSTEYQMTGLGTYYARFSGDKRRLYFNGGGLSIAASALPVSGNGLYADILLRQRRYHRVLADYNSMPLTDIYDEHIAANVGWKRSANSRTALFLHAEHTRRSGDERIGGKSEVNSYPTIGKLTMYKSRFTDLHAGAIYGRKTWNTQLNLGYVSQEEQYAYPKRELSAAHLFALAKGQIFLQPGKATTLRIDAQAAFYANIDKKIDMPFADLSIPITDYVNHKYDFTKAGITSFGAGIRADHKLKNPKYAVFAELNAATDISAAHANRFLLNISLGAAF